MSFFVPANRNVILDILIKRHLFDRDGLALLLTCKFLYGLTTPLLRLQLRAGLRCILPTIVPKTTMHFKRNAPSSEIYTVATHCKCEGCGVFLKCGCGLNRCQKVNRHANAKCQNAARKKAEALKEPCKTCHAPKGWHPTKYDCPFMPAVCPSECKRTGTLQTITPWLAVGPLSIAGLQCAHCAVKLVKSMHVSRESCAQCGIYCNQCHVFTCRGCEQTVRGKDHVCVAYVDRLALHVREMCDLSRAWRIKELEKHDQPLIMVSGKFHSGVHFKWIWIADRNHIPPIPHEVTDSVFLVENTHETEFKPLLHYDCSNARHDATGVKFYITPHPCVVCFQTIKSGRFCDRRCKELFRTRYS